MIVGMKDGASRVVDMVYGFTLKETEEWVRLAYGNQHVIYWSPRVGVRDLDVELLFEKKRFVRHQLNHSDGLLRYLHYLGHGTTETKAWHRMDALLARRARGSTLGELYPVLKLLVHPGYPHVSTTVDTP